MSASFDGFGILENEVKEKGKLKMSNEVIKILDDLSKRFGVAIDWSSENVLPYLKELSERVVKHETVILIVNILFCMTTIAIMYFVGKRVLCFFWKKYKEDKYSTYDFWAYLLGLIMAILFVVLFVTIVSDANKLITCLTLPEKVLIDFMKNIRY